jgi:hypothetical protein
MKRYWFIFGVATVVVVTLLSGYIQGRMSRRWGASRELSAAARKLQEIPETIGPWRLVSTDKMSETVANVLECAGYAIRRYETRQSGDSVTVALLVGPSGPTSVHTPEICYSGVGSRLVEGETKVALDRDASGPETSSFWRTTFQSSAVGGEQFRVYHAWSTGERWIAADDARFAFAAYPYLYKLQIAGPLRSGSEGDEDDACRQFLREFVPAIRPCLLAASRN